MKAMIYTEVEQGSADAERLLNDPQVVMQQKLDGARLLAHLGPWGDGPIFRTRTGAPMKFAAAAQHLRGVHALLPDFPEPVVVDGEIVPETGVFWAFDLVRQGQEALPYEDRLWDLRDTLARFTGSKFQLVPSAFTLKEKAVLFDRAEGAGVEGVMLKSLTSPYRAGERVRDSAKLKFVKTAEVIVLEVNRPDARHGSATLGAYLPGTTTLVNVGACSLIGKPQVAPGDVIEARYLYNSGTTQSPTMYQPRMTQVRYDKEPLDCTTDQFGSYTRKVLL